MDVTFSKKLDAILRRIQINKDRDERESFATICNLGANGTDLHAMGEMKQMLLGSGYIKKFDFSDNGEPYSITDKGVAFLREGGYTGLFTNNLRDDNIKDGTLKSFKYSKFAIAISVLALLVAIASFLVQLFR